MTGKWAACERDLAQKLLGKAKAVTPWGNAEALMFLNKSKAVACIMGCWALAVAESAFADVNCTFAIDCVNLARDATLAASFTADSVSHYSVLCNVNNSWSNLNGLRLSLTLATCTGLHADLLTARSSGRNVTLTFPGLSACTANGSPAGGVPNPYFRNPAL